VALDLLASINRAKNVTSRSQAPGILYRPLPPIKPIAQSGVESPRPRTGTRLALNLANRVFPRNHMPRGALAMEVDVAKSMGQPDTNEGELTKTIEQYTAAIPSSTYLAVAVGAMAVSLVAQLTGRGKWGNFIAQWVPTWLLLGVYNKIVKTEGHD
jgi:hypothetical protein